MSEQQRKFLNGGVFLALGFILFGTLALLNNFGMKVDVNAWDFWPVVLILAGIGVLANSKNWLNILDGVMLTGLGGLILISNLKLIGGFHLQVKKLWPVLILYIGVKIMLQALTRERTVSAGEEDFSISAIFGGGDYRFDAKNMKSGAMTAIFGGGTIDLREAEMEGEKMVLQCFAMFGGIDIRVPEHWQVFVKATPILGGVDNKFIHRNNTGKPANKTLVVEGMVVMGGIDIK